MRNNAYNNNVPALGDVACVFFLVVLSMVVCF
jgi:hypothetical protein